MEQGDSARAEEHFKRYRFLAPDQANPYDSLGELLTNIGRHDEAEANLRKSLEIKGDFFASLGHLGTVAVGRGDYAKAIEYYEKAAEAADTPSAQFDLALSSVFARMFSDDFDGALRKLDVLAATATELAEKHRQRREFVLKVVRAAVLARSGDVPAATAILDELEKWRDVPKEGMESERRIRGLMEATAALKRRDPEPARAFVKAKFVPDGAMSLHSPGYFPAHKLLRVDLASEFLKAGFVADAESLLADVLKVDPNFRVAVDLQRNLEARKAASGARSQTPNG
jgi:tetratricopeptide (TPR) repeat protein